MQTECLVVGDADTALDVRVRFLHLLSREVEESQTPPPEAGPDLEVPSFRPVASLEVNGRIFQTWQEAVEREVAVPTLRVGALLVQSRRLLFNFPRSRELETLRDEERGHTAGVIVRRQEAIEGAIELRITDCGLPLEGHAASSSEINQPRLFRLTARILNLTPFEDATRRTDPIRNPTSRDDALLRSLVSTHTILGVRGGEFVSLLDPPAACKEAAVRCCNVGTWPVLVGAEPERDLMLSSPIILYDYPQVAPESAGDLFDSTEIDEILTLRIMTLTDEEKREMRAADERARQILERTESLPAEQFMKMHGALRSLRPLKKSGQ